MKIALCFHGLPRLIQNCYSDIYNHFIKDNNNIDIYAHFWWDESYKGKINRLHVKEIFDENEDPIELFNNLYKPKKVLYEKCPNDYDCSEFKIEGYNTDNIKNDTLYSKIMASFVIYSPLYCRFSSIKKCLNLINNVDEYDLLIIIRTDLLTFDKNINILSEIKHLDFNKLIYFPSTKEGGIKYAGEHPNKISDWLFMGSPKNILKYINKINDMIVNNKQYDFITPLHNTERFLFWAKHANVNINIYNSSISIRRYIVEEWEDKNYLLKNKINPDYYVNVFDKDNYKFNYNNLLPFYSYNIKIIQ